MRDLMIKIRMSSSDLDKFKSHIENSNGDLSIGLRRKRKLALLLDGDYSKGDHSHEVLFNCFSRIDGLPMLEFKNLPSDKSLNELIKNGELIDFDFIDRDEVELELVTALNDNIAMYEQRKTEKVQSIQKNFHSLYE